MTKKKLKNIKKDFIFNDKDIKGTTKILKDELEKPVEPVEVVKMNNKQPYQYQRSDRNGRYSCADLFNKD